MNISFILLGATFAFIGVVADSEREDRGFGRVLLLVPVLYALLGLACADRARRMLDLARYLNFDLRPRAEKELSNAASVWRWEDYKREQWERRSPRMQGLALTLDKARWLVFTVPSVIALYAFSRLVGFEATAAKIWGAADAALILLVFSILLLAEETRGLKPPSG